MNSAFCGYFFFFTLAHFRFSILERNHLEASFHRSVVCAFVVRQQYAHVAAILRYPVSAVAVLSGRLHYASAAFFLALLRHTGR